MPADVRPYDLAFFTPSSLPAAEWELARRVVLTVIEAIGDLPPSAVGPTASHLCRFLAWSPGWDRQTVPDLTALLTEPAIDAYLTGPAAAELSPGARKVARQCLRRVARVIGGQRVSPTISNPAQQRPGAFWPSVAHQGPLVALVGAAARRGHQFHAMSFHRLGSEMTAGGSLAGLLDVAAPAGGVMAAGTVANVRASARSCRAAKDVVPEVGPMPTKPRSPARSGPKRQLLRDARAQARAALTQPAPVADDVIEPDWSRLDPAVAYAIQNLRPRSTRDRQAWALIGPAGRAALAVYDPPSTRWVQTQGGVIVRYAIWVHQNPGRGRSGPLSLGELAVDTTVEAYLLGPGAAMPDATRATVRSVLRRLVRQARPSQASSRIGYIPVQAPYEPWECAGFVALARNQPSASTRRSLSAMVALGLGAGLDGGDQKRVTPAHVHEVDLGEGQTGLAVQVVGDRPRVVVVRAAYEQLLREALALHADQGRGPNTPLYGHDPERREVTSRVTQTASTALGAGVDIKVNRLRSTWLVAGMCAHVPLSVLLTAAGLSSARSLTDLLPYCPAPDPAEVERILREIDDPHLGQVRP